MSSSTDSGTSDPATGISSISYSILQTTLITSTISSQINNQSTISTESFTTTDSGASTSISANDFAASTLSISAYSSPLGPSLVTVTQTASNPTTPSSSSDPVSTDNGVSNAAPDFTAVERRGFAIGAGVAGVVILFLLFCMLSRKKRRAAINDSTAASLNSFAEKQPLTQKPMHQIDGQHNEKEMQMAFRGRNLRTGFSPMISLKGFFRYSRATQGWQGIRS